ncbi:MAG: hypothetical protein PHO26_10400 [Dehalococcoidia bacterium]|nr:hypothetical protein [Dehalococcoidia bacterium]MDD5493356.1 hypothetical protein [Dehalococcoidia bacterium]
MKIDNCIERLKNSVNNQPYFSGVEGIGGKIKGNKFQLWKRQIGYHNSCGSVLYGNLIADDSGTKISGHFGLDLVVQGIIYAMYGMIVAFGISPYLFILTNMIRGTESPINISPIFYFIIFLAPLILYGFVKILTWFGKKEEKDIVYFLQATLNAHEL